MVSHYASLESGYSLFCLEVLRLHDLALVTLVFSFQDIKVPLDELSRAVFQSTAQTVPVPQRLVAEPRPALNWVPAQGDLIASNHGLRNVRPFCYFPGFLPAFFPIFCLPSGLSLKLPLFPAAI